MRQRKTILREAGALLIAAILLVTSVAVFLPLTQVTQAAPTTLFTEGFEGWVPEVPPIPGAVPPTDWAVYNVNGGNTWVYSSSGQRSGTGCAKCTYDYVTMPNDDWLVTKGTVVAPGGIFEVWVDGYSYGDDAFEIYMSTTGNTVDDFTPPSGTLLVGVYSEVPGEYTQYTFTMPPEVYGQTVYFAIRYIGDYAWYIWVDDVTFPDGSFEGFEGTPGVPGYLPGWTSVVVLGTDPDNEWDCVTTGLHPVCSPYGGSWMARYDSFYISVDNSARLQYNTPFDFAGSGFNVFTLSFFMHHDTGYTSCADSVSVQVSIDGGLTWTTPPGGTFNRNDGTTGWSPHSVDLSMFNTAGAAYIGFYGESFYGNSMFIDDVELTGDMYNAPPYDPCNPDPGDGATATCACLSCLTWEGGDSDSTSVTYDIYLGTTSPPSGPIDSITAPATTTSLSWCPTGGLGLLSDTTYYWRIVATDSDGATTVGPLWSFTTTACVYFINDIYISGNRVYVKLENTIDEKIQPVTLTMTVTITGSPCGCPNPTLNSPHLVETPPGSGIYTKQWTSLNIPKTSEGGVRERSVLIQGGCACFDVTVTVDSCDDPIVTHQCILQETRQGTLCSLRLC
ncbi:MAG: choice-of-anchor J domain-containing protein [Candidatus Thermoplasmatota archaeon]|nr:choice-of-anchor J domain-containing protein [Candidatus Thermoplasmatota archaeon]